MSALLRLLTIFLFFAVVVGAASWFYVAKIAVPSIGETAMVIRPRVELEVPAGQLPAATAQQLENLGVVASHKDLMLFARHNNLAEKWQAGWFSFAGTHTVAEVATALTRGQAQQVAVTFKEGWTAKEWDEALVSAGLTKEGEWFSFIRNPESRAETLQLPPLFESQSGKVLEGYAFPSTYYIDPKAFTIKSFAERAIKNMADELMALQLTEQQKEDIHEIITMASIVELEEKVDARRAVVADILWRRLENNWALGADATLFYELGHVKQLFKKDLALDSPYNTRIKKGLPPTPIASPSRSSLVATMNPKKNRWWFYLHGADGHIHYAVNNAEHEENKKRYL